MKKFLSILACGTMALSLCACGSSEPTEEPEETQEVTEQKNQNSENEMPIIEGTQAYDIIYSLEDMGFTVPDSVNTDDGYTWTSSNAEGSYTIEANSKHEVGYAKFMSLNGASDYISYCATMPADNIDSEQARQWVTNNAGNEVSETFGDALFELSNGTQGPILEIKSLDWDQYLINSMTEE